MWKRGRIKILCDSVAWLIISDRFFYVESEFEVFDLWPQEAPKFSKGESAHSPRQKRVMPYIKRKNFLSSFKKYHVFENSDELGFHHDR